MQICLPYYVSIVMLQKRWIRVYKNSLNMLTELDVRDSKVWERTSAVSEAFADALQIAYDVRRDWYHTSSIHEQENRIVIEDVMNQANRYMLHLNRKLWHEAQPARERAFH